MRNLILITVFFIAILLAGDILIVLGDHEQISALEMEV